MTAWSAIWSSNTLTRRLTVARSTMLCLFVWTLLIALSLSWNVRNENRAVMLQATSEARGHFNKDVAYRRWVASKGGVYVPVSSKTPPNPYLFHVKNRDITTISGRQFTLVNPAYMTRQVMELSEEQYGVRGHITSLKLMRPENKPDPWERQALEKFDQGALEYTGTALLDGKPYLRFMRPFMTEQRCLLCHAAQDYRIGDVRGGISFSIPLEDYYAIRKTNIVASAFWHLAIYLSGCGLIVGAGYSLKNWLKQREANQNQVAIENKRTVALLSLSQMDASTEEQLLDFSIEKTMQLTDSTRGYIHFYDAVNQRLSLSRWDENTQASCQIAEGVHHFELAKNGVWQRCISQGKAIINNNLEPSGATITLPTMHIELKRHLCLPIVDGETIVGVLGVGNKAQPYTKDDLHQLELFTAGVWQVLKRRRAESELARYRNHLEDLVLERTTELEASRTQLQGYYNEVSGAKVQLELANERLKELDKLKSMFIASMSHELRTPLNAIIGFSSLMLNGMTGDINPEQKDQLQRVLRAGRHLLALITDVIDISKIESKSIEPFASEFDLLDVIDESCANVALQLEEKGLQLVRHIDDEEIILFSDRKRLLQCILNYLSNAMKFTSSGCVEIAVQHDDENVTLCVVDSGSGISSDEMALLFKSFTRLASTSSTTPGTGLGLYLTKKLAEEVLGGRVWAESTPGSGSRFYLQIPKRLQT